MLAVLIAAAAALPPAPREALLDDAPAQVTVARAQPRGEPLRGVAEYAAALAAFTIVNAGGSALLSDSRVTVAKGGSVSFNGSQASLVGAGACFRYRPGTVHRVTAIEDTTILEVSTPELDDVVRLEDRYGREGTSEG